ncbi:MAG: two-component regulator propeller domain-containing protein [Blastocatellia bacterium]
MPMLPRQLFHCPFFTLAFWLLSLPHFATAQQLPLTSYTTADGLAHNGINRIVKDSRGFLWLCTEEGLSRFDGYTFTNYGVEQGLPHRTVTDFLETRAGEFWVATYGGLVSFNPKGAPLGSVIHANEVVTPAPMFTVVVAENGAAGLRELPGIGEAISKKIVDLLATGSFKAYEEVRAEIPESTLDLLKVDGVGIKTLRIFYHRFCLTNLSDFAKFVAGGGLDSVAGMGEKTQARIRASISQLGYQME